MINVTVKIGEQELYYEFSEMWQVDWVVRSLNWYLGLPEGGLTKRAVDGLSRLLAWVSEIKNNLLAWLRGISRRR
jgi:hypothetical protein